MLWAFFTNFNSTNWATKTNIAIKTKTSSKEEVSEWSRHLSNFPGRHQPSIFDVKELNCRVRNGNGWDLFAISTDWETEHEENARENELKGSIRKSVRPISTCWLNVSPRLHLRPINLVVYKGSYRKGGYLILRTASRLDAFSVYPNRT